MGTNFYLIMPAIAFSTDALSTEALLGAWAPAPMHIGKRSAAGPYCWDCKTTLCVQGDAGVHASTSTWHTCCPKCGQVPDETGIGQAASLEVGFKTVDQLVLSGVRSCSSFRWGMLKDRVLGVCEASLETPIIQDEYNRPYTGASFLKLLDACPIEFESIGEDFS